MKKLFRRIASKSAKNEKFFAYIESNLGEKLTWEQKIQAMQNRKAAAKLYKKGKISSVPATANKTRISSILRYGSTAVFSIILCLAVVLPITLGNGNDIKGGDGVDTSATVYSDGIPSISITEYWESYLAQVDGLLLFGSDCEIGSVEGVYMDIADDNNSLILGYRFINLTVAYGGIHSDIYQINLIIRTYANYQFPGFGDFKSNTEQFKEVTGAAIPAQCFIKNGETLNATALITFKHGGHEYFFTVKKLVGDPISHNEIKNVILADFLCEVK